MAALHPEGPPFRGHGIARVSFWAATSVIALATSVVATRSADAAASGVDSERVRAHANSGYAACDAPCTGPTAT